MATPGRRTAGAVMALVAGLGLVLTGCGRALDPDTAFPPAPTPAAVDSTPAAPAAGPTAATPEPTPSPTPAKKSSTASGSNRHMSLGRMTAKPRLVAGPAILKSGSSGRAVRDLQARLKQIGWFAAAVTGTYGSTTAAGVQGFQAKRAIPVTGAVDQRTLDRLRGMTRAPSNDELHNRVPKPSASGLDRRCLTGRAMCISKSNRSLVWVINGKPQLRMDVRFGSYETPTREGSFTVGWKSRHHVSTIYHTSMPYAMFFSGGQAVHYSPDFAARGYAGASHGCVNVRNLSGIQWLFDQVRVGDKVVVYR